MAVCRDGCAIYLVSRAEMISAHSHSGSVRAGRARGRTSRTFHTATLTRETLPARPDGKTHMLAHTQAHTATFENGKSTTTLHIR